MRWAINRVLAYIFPFVSILRNTYRRIRRPITIGTRALIVADEQVVLIRTHGGTMWDLPGGGVKRGELLRAAAIREAEEETGCAIEVVDVLGVYLNTQQGLSDHVTVFICRPRSAPSIGLNFEIAEARFWPLAALPPNVLPAVQRRIAEYRSGRRGIEGHW